MRMPSHPPVDQECRGCGATFRTHTRSRAYCDGQCKFAAKIAREMRSCVGCGTSDLDRPVLVFLRTPEYEREKQLGVEFAIAHKHCRAAMLEPRGTSLECQCRPCLISRGEQAPEPRRRKGHRRKTYVEQHRDKVYERDRLICQICQIPTDPNAGLYDDRRPVLDHIVRVADGGSDQMSNLRTAHRWCNIALEGPSYWGEETVVRARAIERFSGTI